MPRRTSALLVPLGIALAATLAGAPAAQVAAGRDLPSPNGPGLDHFFTLDGGPNLSRESAAALAGAPSGADPAAFNAQALAAAQKLPVTAAASRWKQVGPAGGIVEDPARGATSSGRLRVTGITLSLAADPRSPASTVYVGSGGGLWKTSDAGASWTQMAIPSVPVGAVGVSPKDPDVVVAGTGQAFQGGGEGGGLGAYVSHDGGRTWTRPVKNVQGNGGQQVSISPDGTIFVATDRGLYRSTDDGASFVDVALPTNAEGTAPATGTPVGSWTSDVKVRPGHPAEVYAAVGYVAGQVKTPDGHNAAPGNGLYRSTSGGAPGTWKRLDVSSPATGWKQNPLESSDPIGRTRLAFTPDGNSLYALVADAGNRSARTVSDQALPLGAAHTTSLNGLYKTDAPGSPDTAPTWQLKATSETLTAAPAGSQVVLSVANRLGYQPGIQAWYNGWIAVDPVTPSRVFLGEEETYVSTGGTETPGPATFTVIDRYISPCALTDGTSCPAGTPLYGGLSTHPDQHAGLPVPAGNGTRLWSGNDGGTFRQDSHSTTDGASFDNEHWTTTARYNTTLPYRAVKGSDGSVISGLQDNGTAKYYPGDRDAVEICGGDGTGVAIAPDHPNTFYCQANGSLEVTTDGGKTTSDAGAPVAPAFVPAAFTMDPTNERHLVIGDDGVYETTKGSGSGSSDWAAVFTNPDGAYTQAVDTYGAAVYDAYCVLCASSVKAPITATDRGLATNVKAGCTAKSGSTDCWHAAALKGMPSRQINALAIDPANARNVYLATGIPSVVRVDFGGVDAPRVLLSTDAGETVKDVSGNLPRGNVWDVKVAGKRVYVATDLGVFTATVGSTSWSRLGSGLPVVRAFGLSISSNRDELVAATYGAGVWTLPLVGGRATLTAPQFPSAPAGSRPSGSGSGEHLAATGLPAGLAGGGLVLLLGAAALRRRRPRAVTVP